jgi:hypothetical protein
MLYSSFELKNVFYFVLAGVYPDPRFDILLSLPSDFWSPGICPDSLRWSESDQRSIRTALKYRFPTAPHDFVFLLQHLASSGGISQQLRSMPLTPSATLVVVPENQTSFTVEDDTQYSVQYLLFARNQPELTQLSSFPSLKVLDLTNDRSFQWIAALAQALPSSSIESLSICAADFFTDELTILAPSLKGSRVTHLSLANESEDHDLDLASLTKVQPQSSLTSLSLVSPDLSLLGISDLVKNGTLKELLLSCASEHATDVSSALASSSLLSLHLAVLIIDNPVVQDLPSTKITSLSLRRCLTETTVKLTAVLPQCSHLTSLDLCNSHLMDQEADFFAAVAKTHITSLYLERCSLTDFDSILVALPKTKLRTLSLSRNLLDVSDGGKLADSLIDAVKASSHLEYLVLDRVEWQYSRIVQPLVDRFRQLKNSSSLSISSESPSDHDLDQQRVLTLLSFMLRAPSNKSPGYFLCSPVFHQPKSSFHLPPFPLPGFGRGFGRGRGQGMGPMPMPTIPNTGP